MRLYSVPNFYFYFTHFNIFIIWDCTGLFPFTFEEMHYLVAGGSEFEGLVNCWRKLRDLLNVRNVSDDVVFVSFLSWKVEAELEFLKMCRREETN